jgi:hypothetical protein
VENELEPGGGRLDREAVGVGVLGEGLAARERASHFGLGRGEPEDAHQGRNRRVGPDLGIREHHEHTGAPRHLDQARDRAATRSRDGQDAEGRSRIARNGKRGGSRRVHSLGGGSSAGDRALERAVFVGIVRVNDPTHGAHAIAFAQQTLGLRVRCFGRIGATRTRRRGSLWREIRGR